MKTTSYVARGGSVEFNMTPMIDVVFLLIIFFLVSSHLAQQEAHLELPLPVAQTGDNGEDDDLPKITVNVLEDGEYRLGGRRVDEATLLQRLQERQAAEDQPVLVSIRTSRRVAYRDLTPVLAACAKSGIDHVIFATYREKN
jgi:biopolymer transport protein ExbD